jgi:hypothetical protein
MCIVLKLCDIFKSQMELEQETTIIYQYDLNVPLRAI